MPLNTISKVASYSPATIKRMVMCINENPGITSGQVAAACGLDRARCAETLREHLKALNLEMDPQTKRLYPSGFKGIKRNTKAGREAAAEVLTRAIAALPAQIAKIAGPYDKEKASAARHLEEKVRQAEARKLAWEQEKLRRGAREKELAHEREMLRLQQERERLEEERTLRIEREKQQQQRHRNSELRAVGSMDREQLSHAITAPGFDQLPEQIQTAMVDRWLALPDQPTHNEPSPRRRRHRFLKGLNKKPETRIILPAILALLALVIWAAAATAGGRP